MRKNEPPPKVGARFYRRNDAAPYHVRAVVDLEELEDIGPWYHVVLRYYSRRKGWRYVIENAFAFTSFDEYGPLYTRKKRKP